MHRYIYTHLCVYVCVYMYEYICVCLHTYIYTKTINDLITPYLSHNYSIKSTQELIEILKTQKPNKGIISSLDVKNLF